MSSFSDLRNRRALAGLVLVWLAAIGCGPSHSQPAPVVILAAASTKDLLREIIAVSQPPGAPPLPIEISTGPSQSLAQQVLSGAPADIYISAHADWANELDAAGLAEKSVPWVSNQLVLVAPRNSGMTQLSDLRSPRVKRLAIAGERVPAGTYAEQALRAAGLWEELQEHGKIIRGHDVRSTLAYASRNEVDAAIVYASDAKIAANLKVVARFDSSTHQPIVYHLVRIRTNRSAPLADQVFQWLQGEQAMSIAREHGFADPLSSDSGG